MTASLRATSLSGLPGLPLLTRGDRPCVLSDCDAAEQNEAPIRKEPDISCLGNVNLRSLSSKQHPFSRHVSSKIIVWTNKMLSRRISKHSCAYSQKYDNYLMAPTVETFPTRARESTATNNTLRVHKTTQSSRQHQKRTRNFSEMHAITMPCRQTWWCVQQNQSNMWKSENTNR